MIYLILALLVVLSVLTRHIPPPVSSKLCGKPGTLTPSQKELVNNGGCYYEGMEMISFGCHTFKKDQWANAETQADTMNANKPKRFTGLWSSPVGSQYGWVHWCQHENFWFSDKPKTLKNKISQWNTWMVFTLKKEARVFVIDTLEDYESLISLYGKIMPCGTNGYMFAHYPRINWELFNEDYDALHLTEHGQVATRDTYMHGWDMETVLVTNIDVVEFKYGSNPFNHKVLWGYLLKAYYLCIAKALIAFEKIVAKFHRKIQDTMIFNRMWPYEYKYEKESEEEDWALDIEEEGDEEAKKALEERTQDRESNARNGLDSFMWDKFRDWDNF